MGSVRLFGGDLGGIDVILCPRCGEEVPPDTQHYGRLNICWNDCLNCHLIWEVNNDGSVGYYSDKMDHWENSPKGTLPIFTEAKT